MYRIAKLLSPLLLVVILTNCGATPGFTDTETTLPDAPTYLYIDTKGNNYAISQNKLLYDPVSADNTIDGLDDEGYHLEINISVNDYAKIASVCNEQFNQTQKDLPVEYSGYVIPRLLRRYPTTTDEIKLSLVSVEELDYVLKPFLNDE